jgi:hypothetical protein
MFRLRDWVRVGLVAIVLASSAAWISVWATPAAAITSGAKSLDPGDPSLGGGAPTAGDPDGPSGDIGPASGASASGGSSSISGGFSSTVVAPTVTAQPAPTHRTWLQMLWLTVSLWLRRGLLP